MKTSTLFQFCAGASALLFLGISSAAADVDPKAAEILKGFCDKITEAKGFAYTAYRTVDPEIALETGVQKSARIEIMVSRPNQLSMSSHGNLGTMRIIFDGSSVTLYDELMNLYAAAAAGPEIDDLVKLMGQTFGESPPLVELAVKDPYTALTEGMTEGRHAGVEKIRGIECDRLSFSGRTESWDIWIDREEGLPQKMEVTYQWANQKTPKVRIDFIGWGKSEAMEGRGFTFEVPRGAKRAPLEAIQEIEKNRYKAQVKSRK
jgi:hypothetical protein